MYYWITYRASIEIEAENEEEAKETFYQVYADDTRIMATVEEVVEEGE